MDSKKEYLKWLEKSDEATKKELSAMTEDDIKENFFRDLEFGTGGLRGIMAAGINRMNIYTVRKATQGLAMEVLDSGDAKDKGVVVAYDSRNNSALFAKEAANVLCANGIKTYLFDSLRPTPELSFAVRYLGCARGIVITASHNPKEYNGYKVYGEDGGQIPPETADKIIKYISEVDVFDGVKLCDDAQPIIVGKEVDDAFIAAIKEQSYNISIPDDFKMIYTPIHGSGNIPVRRILEEIGVKNLFVVPEQEKPDGNFPSVVSPNPENAEAFTIAVKYAKEQGADLIIGTDPDSDRIGVVVKDSKGEYVVFTGNQTGALLCEYILRKAKEAGTLPEKATVVKTIVTTEMVKPICDAYGATLVDVLTGFKFIGEKIMEYELEGDKERYMLGFEESYGYLKGTYARDKDAVVAAMLITEMAADYKKSGKTLYDALMDLYKEYGFFRESLETKTLTGIEGMEMIKKIMKKFRENELPVPVERLIDYKDGVDGLPPSDVLKFFIKDGWFAVRPSGTEPKIKFYFGVKGTSVSDAEEKLSDIQNKIMNFAE
ncbi:MAG: phospho-sugar mutase [Ruminococcaceae bacterium]|nr:phospho-sugar mutase [Oscillospiraceae bacterium]